MNPGTQALPQQAHALLTAGAQKHGAGDLAGALADYQAAARLAPDNEQPLAAIAALAMDARDWEAAERILRALEAGHPGRHTPRLALTLFNRDKYAEALPLLEGIVNSGQPDLSCVLAFAACLERTGEEDRALRVLEEIYRALPNLDSAVRLASAMMRMQRRAELEIRLPQLLAGHADNPKLLSVKSEHLLKCGDYAAGFDLAGYRWATALESRRLDQLACPAWDGTRFDGPLLVTAEQGLGDEILASSLLGDLVALGQHAEIECDARLLPVFRRSFPSLVFHDRQGDSLSRLANNGSCRKAEALELARFFRRSAADFPARSRWLRADPQRAAALRAGLAGRFPGKRLVGLSWRSGRAFLGTAKSVPLTDLEPLFHLPDTVFIDLQYGMHAAEKEAFHAKTGFTVHTVPGVDNTADIDGLFALVSVLDAVVSCSNTTVHIAGSLGVKTLALVPGTRYALWYWGYEGSTTPWYSSVSLLRGPSVHAWRELAGQSARLLAEQTGPAA